MGGGCALFPVKPPLEGGPHGSEGYITGGRRISFRMPRLHPAWRVADADFRASISALHAAKARDPTLQRVEPMGRLGSVRGTSLPFARFGRRDIHESAGPLRCPRHRRLSSKKVMEREPFARSQLS